MKRILIFSLAYYPDMVSGAEVAVKEITDRISREDIEFHLITLLFDRSRPHAERIGNVTVYRVGFGGGYLSKMLYISLAVWKACDLHRRRPFDALWSVMTYMLFPVVLAKWFGVRVPHILTLQDGDPYERVFERWFIRPLTPVLDYGFRTARIVQAISSYLGEWARRRGYQGTLEIIYNGANARDFAEATSDEEIEALKQSLGKKDKDVFIVTTSRLAHKNGIDAVIAALPLLPDNVSFVIVGGGEDEKKLKDQAESLGVSGRTLFVGNVERTETPKYRRIADIFARPSRSEGLGNSFASAMAAHLPIIATQEGGIKEFLFDEKRDPEKPTTGWAVDVDSPEQIADAVTDILANPDKVRLVTENAYRLAYEQYNWDTIAAQMRNRVFGPVIDS